MSYEQRRTWALANPERVKAAKARYNAKPEAKAKAREQAKAWRAKNKDRINLQRRAERLLNPDKYRAKQLRARLRNGGWGGDPRRHRRNQLAARYALTPDEYNQLLERQGWRCAICSATSGNSKGHSLFVDHCHSTGVVRGLLCGRCNHALGLLEDDPIRLRRAADYLEVVCRIQRTA